MKSESFIRLKIQSISKLLGPNILSLRPKAKDSRNYWSCSCLIFRFAYLTYWTPSIIFSSLSLSQSFPPLLSLSHSFISLPTYVYKITSLPLSTFLPMCLPSYLYVYLLTYVSTYYVYLPFPTYLCIIAADPGVGVSVVIDCKDSFILHQRHYAL